MTIPIPPWKKTLTDSIEAKGKTAIVINGIVAYENDNFCKLCGSVAGKPFTSLLAEGEINRLEAMVGDTRLCNTNKDIFTLEGANTQTQSVMLETFVIDETTYIASIIVDYAPESLTGIDALTRLPNRHKANSLLESAMRRAERGTGFCLAIADVDFFKSVNDAHGHDVGDQVLLYVGQIISSTLRSGDWACRWGGEEFLIFIENDSLEASVQPLERIHHRLNNSLFSRHGGKLKVTMSFGVTCSKNRNSIAEIIHEADLLMYEAKRSGRNRVVWREDSDIIWVASNVQSAVDNGKIAPQYCPAHNWEHETDIVFVRHGIRDSHNNQVKNMLSAANRLKKRGIVDNAILQQVAKDISENDVNVPMALPVCDDLIINYKNILATLITENPSLFIGISAKEPLSTRSMDTLVKIKAPMALLDFSPSAALHSPMHFLQGDLRCVVYVDPDKSAAPLLSVIPPNIKCYAYFSSAETGRSYKSLQADGFSGVWQFHVSFDIADIL